MYGARMRERSAKCTLYSAYVTPDDPRGASDPAGTRRGPLGRTTYHDRYSHAQHASSPIHSTFSNRAAPNHHVQKVHLVI